MNATTRIRVLISCRSAGPNLFRTLMSLACQTVDPQRLKIILCSTRPAEHRSQQARLLHSALDLHDLEVLDASEIRPAQALNLAAQAGPEEILALLPEGARLSPLFMARCLLALNQPKAQAAYAAHTAGTPDSTPFVRQLSFNTEQLARRNAVAPAALVRRAAWEHLGGLNAKVQLALWDFWLRLALARGEIIRVPDLLTSCPALQRATPWQDGQAKAQLVISLPGAFEPDVCRWAMALLRGDAWASPFEPGQIPGPRDVQAMTAGHCAARRSVRQDWSAAHLSTA